MDIDFKPTPHREAAATIRNKIALPKRVFEQLLPELRNRAFTVTGIESANALQTIREQIAGLPEGVRWDDAKQEIVDSLEPFLGEGPASENRATLLLRTHGFQAFNASTWKLAQEDDETTHLQYLATEDDRVRDSHLALNGIVLPKNDPFWDLHYPPWEWNCRCRVRTMSADQVSDERHDDIKRPPEGKLVLEGATKRKLEEGFIVRPEFPSGISVLPDERPGAFRFHPDNLVISLAQLKARYDEPTWEAFKTNSQNTEITPGFTLWDYLIRHGGFSFDEKELARIAEQTEREKAPVSFGPIKDAQEWADANMHPDKINLTEREREYLSAYQSSSIELNKALISGNIPGAERAQMQAIDSAIAKSKLKQPMDVWRGGTSPRWATYKPGDIIENKAFLSTTLAEDMTDFKESAWIRIHLPTGANALYMDKIHGNQSFADEVEILLGREGKLRINSVETRGGIAYVDATLVS